MDEPRTPGREQDLPASVSNQNGEEAEPGHDDRAHAHTHRAAGSDGEGGDSSDGGAAGEGSQSTGDPNSAG